MADVGFRLKVEGEAEFNAALKQINDNIKLNKAQIELLTEEYNNNGGAIDTLAKKSDVLREAADRQAEKVQKMKDYYAAAAQQLDETDPKMVKLATEITKQETELVKLNAAYDANEKALKSVQDGVSSYDSSISELSGQAAELRAEIEKTDSELAKNNESLKNSSAGGKDAAASYEQLSQKAELTAKKHEQLTSYVDKQRQAVELNRQALAAAQKGWGESSDQVEKYRKALEQSEKELEAMEKELAEAGTAAKAAGDEMTGIGSGLPEATSNAQLLGDAFGGVGSQVGGILDQVGVQLPAGLESVAGQFGIVAGAAGAVISAVTGIVEEMNKARDEAAAYIDDLNTTASIADLPTDVIQEWQYMSDMVDVSVDTITKSLQKLKEYMRDATSEGRGWIQVGNEIVPIYDEQTGELRDLNDVFLDTIDGLKGVDDYLERDAVSMEIFGKKANELNPLLAQSRQNIELMRQAAHDYGYVTEDAANTALSRYQDIKDQLAKVKEAYERNSAAYRQMRAHAGEYSQVELDAIRRAKGESEKAYASFLWQSEGIVNKIKAIFHTISAVQRDAVMDITGHATGTTSAPSGLSWVGEQGTEIVRTVGQNIRSAAPLARAIEAATGGTYTAVGENGPELVNLRGGERIYPHGQIPADLRKLGITAAIKGYAEGVISAPAGLALTGERGAEIVRTGAAMTDSYAQSVTNYYDVRIDASRVKEFEDIVRIAQNEKRMMRMGYSGR